MTRRGTKPQKHPVASLRAPGPHSVWLDCRQLLDAGIAVDFTGLKPHLPNSPLRKAKTTTKEKVRGLQLNVKSSIDKTDQRTKKNSNRGRTEQRCFGEGGEAGGRKKRVQSSFRPSRLETVQHV